MKECEPAAGTGRRNFFCRIPYGGTFLKEEPNDADMKQVFRLTLCAVMIIIALFSNTLIASPQGPSEDALKATTERLQKIHTALLAFEKKHRRWPDWLSDLVPEYLPDEAALRDPADPGSGSLGSDQAYEDPKFRVSYSYERCAKISNGLPGPLGPFPKPDVGNAWGTWRLVNGHQEYFWGDQVPLVRCYLHRPPEEERADGHDLVLNLTPSGRIYRSKYDWNAHPDSIEFVLRTLARDMQAGFKHVGRHWYLGRVREYLDGNDDALADARFAPLLTELAGGFMSRLKEFGDAARVACQLAALFELKLGHPDKCLAALDEAAKHPGPKWAPLIDGQRRAEAHRAAKNFAEEVATYRRLLELSPDNQSYLRGLAAALESSGDKTAAAAIRAASDPGAALVGKKAPDFSVALADGGQVDLKSALAGKKALLLNFWFLGCGPCRQEMPHLQALHERHRDTLGMLCINSSDKAAEITKFAAEKKFTLPFALGKDAEGKDHPVFSAWHVSVYPTNYLIGKDGKILWRGTGFGAEDLRSLEAALAAAGVK